MKKNLLLVCFVTICIGLVAYAKPKDVKLTGIIVDKACSAKISKKENPQEAAAGHTIKCATMEGCAKSGYGVFSDGKYYEFDAKGSELAKALLGKTSAEKGLQVTVEGSADEANPSMITVKKIEEAKASK